MKTTTSTYSHPVFYAESNETQAAESLDFLTSGTEPGTYVGVSGLQNYSMIAARKSTDAIFVDINDTTCRLHEAVKAAFSEFRKSFDPETADPEAMKAFAQKFLQELDKAELSIPDELRERIQKAELYWLQNIDRFLHIKNMFDNDRVEIRNLNLASNALIDHLKERKIDVIYISNVADWLIEKPQELSALDSNLQKLAEINPQIRIIYSDGTLKIDANDTMSYHPIVRNVSVGYRSDIVITPIREHFMEPAMHSLVTKFQTIIDTSFEN